MVLNIYYLMVSLTALFGGDTTMPANVPGPIISVAPVTALMPAGMMLPAIASSARDAKLRIYMDDLGKGFDKRVQEVLPKIDGVPRRLLAIRYYMRRRGDMRTKWTWTPKQIARYKKSSEYSRSMAEVDSVKAKFNILNPGYNLTTNIEVRTLDDQIRNWNQTPSIFVCANDLMASCINAIADSVLYLEDPDRASLARFARFLDGYKPSQVPTVAVPGFSQHGQLRAFDFVVRSGERVIAGTETGSIRSAWDRAGWTAKLHDAVTQGSKRFVGPLASPREPWHYTYQP
ncbi:MAG: hypothetical protein ABIR47_16535 [Candidatus Kapaibacterium sp.]